MGSLILRTVMYWTLVLLVVIFLIVVFIDSRKADDPLNEMANHSALSYRSLAVHYLLFHADRGAVRAVMPLNSGSSPCDNGVIETFSFDEYMVDGSTYRVIVTIAAYDNGERYVTRLCVDGKEADVNYRMV